MLKGLTKKGPGGIPIWIYAVMTAVVLYFGYRWYKNRGNSASNSSGSGGTVDTSGAGDSGNSEGDTSGGSSAGDSGAPGDPGSTNNPPTDSTGTVNGAMITTPTDPGSTTTVKHHKQGVKHTGHRAIHRRKQGENQTHHAHAPKERKRMGSREKVTHVSAPKGHHAPAKTQTRGGEQVLHGGNAPPPTIKHETKTVPKPIEHKETPKVEAKSRPPEKRRRK